MPDHLLNILSPQARVDQFTAIFGSSRVPVTTQHPQLAMLEGVGPTSVYYLDLHAISISDTARLLKHLATAHGVSEMDVEARLLEDGVPITAQGTEMLTMPMPESCG